MYIFRADANKIIGTGHIMRCLTIADALTANVEKDRVLFVCADEETAKIAFNRGYTAYVLNTPYDDMESELGLWEKFATGKDVILCDSYQITDAYLEALKKFGPVMCMDDMAWKKINANVVTNYNAFANDTLYQPLYAGTDVELLLGASYAPMRPEFSNTPYQVQENVRNVLITTGGADNGNVGGQIAEFLLQNVSGIDVHLIVGHFSPNKEKLEAFAKREPRLHLHIDVKDMVGLMKDMDVSVSAGGTTVYELCAVGVPLICFSFVDNQEQIAQSFEPYNLYAGKFHVSKETVLKRIGDLLDLYLAKDGYLLRKEKSELEKHVIDGHGAERIARKLMNM